MWEPDRLQALCRVAESQTLLKRLSTHIHVSERQSDSGIGIGQCN